MERKLISLILTCSGIPVAFLEKDIWSMEPPEDDHIITPRRMAKGMDGATLSFRVF